MHLPVSSIFKKYVFADYSQQTAPEIALPLNRPPGLHLYLAACEPLEVSPFVQASFESRRRYLKGVGSMNEVFHIQNRPQVSAYFRAILVGHTLRLVNEDTNNRFVLGAGYLGVNQLEAMVDCHSFS